MHPNAEWEILHQRALLKQAELGEALRQGKPVHHATPGIE
jgi:hypothetical protein